MNSYFEAKTKLFTENLLDGGTAVINIDDNGADSFMNS